MAARRSLRATPNKTGAEAEMESEPSPRNVVTRRKREAVAAALADSSDSRSNTPAGRSRRLSNAAAPAVQAELETPVRRSKRLSETLPAGPLAVAILPHNDESAATAGGTPQKSRRLSETVQTAAVATPPTRRRDKKVAENDQKEEEAKEKAAKEEAAKAEAVEKPTTGTPRKSTRRRSELLLSTDENVAVASPLRHRKVSELSAVEITSRPGTPPVRKSRRLSGGRLEEVAAVDSLPLTPTRKSRRLSSCLDIPPAISEEQVKDGASGEAEESGDKEEAIKMEVIAEAEDEGKEEPEEDRSGNDIILKAIPEAEEEFVDVETASDPEEKEAKKELTEENATNDRVVLANEVTGEKELSASTRALETASSDADVTAGTGTGNETPETVSTEAAETAGREAAQAAGIDAAEAASSGVAAEEIEAECVQTTADNSVVGQNEEPVAEFGNPIDHKDIEPRRTESCAARHEADSPAKSTQIASISKRNQPSTNDLLQEPTLTNNKENISKESKSSKGQIDPLEALQRLMLPQVPRQKPKSGKFWKADRSQFRAIRKDKGLRKTFEQRLQTKEEIQRAKELAAMLLQAKVEQKQELRQRAEENKKRREEREKKAEVYQIVRNPNKIKKLKRKDLVKRDILGKVQS